METKQPLNATEWLAQSLLCYVLRITSTDQLFAHPLRGAIFENWVVSERLKGFFNAGDEAPLYFWRDSKGLEVDLVVDRGTDLAPTEIKAGATFDRSFTAALERFAALQIVYGGDVSFDRRCRPNRALPSSSRAATVRAWTQASGGSS